MLHAIQLTVPAHFSGEPVDWFKSFWLQQHTWKGLAQARPNRRYIHDYTPVFVRVHCPRPRPRPLSVSCFSIYPKLLMAKLLMAIREKNYGGTRRQYTCSEARLREYRR